MRHLGWLDLSVLLIYTVTLAGIGWWAARRQHQTTDDYFLAGRSIPWLITTASFLATCISALTFVGTPSEGYGADFRYLFSNVGDIGAAVFVALVLLPFYQSHKVTSIYAAVEKKMGRLTRRACSGYFIATRTLAATVRIVAIAKVLEVVSGGALSFPVCVVATVAVILLYTTAGGGRAIAWTDTLQFCLLIGGGVVALFYIAAHVPGGFAGIVEAGRHAVKPDGTAYDKFNFLEMYKPKNLGLFALLAIWGFFNSSAAYGTDQDMVQRLLACNDERKARWSMIVAGLVSIPISGLFLFIGVGLYAYAKTHPALTAGMTDNDFVFPRFILTQMPEGLRGLLLAAVASAAMGSSDSALASLATAFTVDFYQPIWGQGRSERDVVRFSKRFFVGFGAIFVALALLMRNLDNLLWLAFRMVAYTYGPLLGTILVATLTNWKVDGRKVLGLMLACTVLTFGLEMTAWYLVAHGTTSVFWTELHHTYWRLYVIFGALAVPAGCWLMRES
ncbi:MAG: sodium/solute symporter [Elusimicrobia bacterium]|nr:sodium/solute symporter [Elusimicrobiota bacterium]